MLSNCATVPDSHFCIETRIDQGFCITAVSGKGQYVDDKRPLYDPIQKKKVTWWDMRPTMIEIPYFDYVEWKKYIMTNCKKTGKCDERVTNYKRSLEIIDKVIEEK